MRSTSDVLHNHGGLTEYTTKDGKVLQIKYLTLKGMSEYENRLQNRAIKKLSEQKDNISKEIFNQMFSELLDKIASGSYAFGSEICTKSLPTVQGVCDVISILCDVPAETALDLIVAEGTPLQMLIQEILRKSIGSKDDEVAETSSGNE
jgi:hypothetical protein